MAALPYKYAARVLVADSLSFALLVVRLYISGDESGMTTPASTSQTSSAGGGPLKPNFLATPGDPPMHWEMWIRLFTDHLLAHNLDGVNDRRKLAILRSSLGAEGFRICTDLCPEVDITFDQTVDRLQKRFAPAPSHILARARFNRRIQLPDEDVGQFVTALRALATKCGYPEDGINEFVRDRLVAGARDDKIRERLLQEPDSLTLNTALTLAQTYERAATEKQSVTDGSTPVVDQVSESARTRHQERRTNEPGTRSSRLCFNCGRPGHLKRDPNCPARGVTCNNCGRVGHFARVCRKDKELEKRNRDSTSQLSRSRGLSSVQGSHNLPRDTSSSESESTTVGVIVNTSNCGGSALKRISCKVGGSDIDLLVDSGAAASILNKATLYKLCPHPRLNEFAEQLKSYTGNRIRVLGSTRLPVKCDNQLVQDFRFLVVEDGDNLMGVDLLRALGANITLPGSGGFRKVLTLVMDSSDLLKKFPNLTMPPRTIKRFVHMPTIDATVRPCSQPFRRVPIALEEKVNAELERLETDGIIEKINASPWTSNMVVVKKPDGGVRICIDLSQANQAVVADRYPLPTIEELTKDFAGATYFSKLDLKWGYLQVLLHPDARYLTGMITPLGLFRWTRMPFGLSSAPSAFQKIIAAIIKGCMGSRNLLDDIAVWGRTKAEHDERLAAVLKRLDKYNVRLNAAKCLCGVTEMDYIGHHFSAKGVTPLQSNVESIMKMPEPTNVKQLASFIGAAGYYMKFVPGFAKTIQPLRELMQKDAEWRWSEDCRAAFEEIRRKISRPPVLAHFKPDAATVVISDASADAIGAVLSQMANGSDRPIAYASRALTPTERNYSATEREALAAIWACERWHYYLYGRRFTIRTDHQSLTQLLSAKGAGRRPMRLMRWADRLLQYDFHVEHLPGRSNNVADMLSRHTTEREEKSEDDMGDTAQLATIFGNSTLATITSKELEAATKNDKTLQLVRNSMSNRWPTEKIDELIKPFYMVRDELTVISGCVFRGERACVPAELRSDVLKLAHEGHPGINKMKQRLRDTVWWPGIDGAAERHVKECTACIVSNKAGTNVPTPPLQPLEYPARPWQKVALDIVGELKGLPENHRYLLVLIDLHSKWPEIRATASITTSAVREFLADCFARWGLPDEIITDNGRQFVSQEFERFLQQHGVKHCKTALYHPQANGAVERFNRVIKDCLKTARVDEVSPKTALRAMITAYRATPHATTGITPAELMIGRKVRSTLDVLKPTIKKHVRLNKSTQRVHIQQQRQKRNADEKRHARPALLKAGEWVRVRIQKRDSKLAEYWSEPRRIERMIGPSTALFSDGTRWNACQLRRDCGPEEEDDEDGWEALRPDDPEPQPIPKKDDRQRRMQPLRNRRLPTHLNDFDLKR